MENSVEKEIEETENTKNPSEILPETWGTGLHQECGMGSDSFSWMLKKGEPPSQKKYLRTDILSRLLGCILSFL